MGKGLREQIEAGENTFTYKPMSNKDFGLAMTDIFVKPEIRAELDLMLSKKQVTEKEYASLLKMINSPDNENLTVAKAIMQLKKPNQDGNNIQSS